MSGRLPVGWDVKSWQDVVDVHDQITRQVNELRVLLLANEPQGTDIAAIYSRLSRLSQFGQAAAEWVID